MCVCVCLSTSVVSIDLCLNAEFIYNQQLSKPEEGEVVVRKTNSDTAKLLRKYIFGRMGWSMFVGLKR